MLSKIFYCTKVVAYGILCIITKLEFFQHHFSKMGHGNTSCDPHLHLSHQATNAALPHAQRPPPGGYVLNAETVQVKYWDWTHRSCAQIICAIQGVHPNKLGTTWEQTMPNTVQNHDARHRKMQDEAEGREFESPRARHLIELKRVR